VFGLIFLIFLSVFDLTFLDHDSIGFEHQWVDESVPLLVLVDLFVFEFLHREDMFVSPVGSEFEVLLRVGKLLHEGVVFPIVRVFSEVLFAEDRFLLEVLSLSEDSFEVAVLYEGDMGDVGSVVSMREAFVVEEVDRSAEVCDLLAVVDMREEVCGLLAEADRKVAVHVEVEPDLVLLVF